MLDQAGGTSRDIGARGTGSSAGNWFCAALLFVLFVEWLRPLYAIPELTEMYQLAPFMTAMGSFLLLHVLGIRLVWSLALHGLIIVGVVAYFFNGMWLWDPIWWGKYAAQLRLDVQVILSGRWVELSGESRTFLFLAGWGMILYAVYTIMAIRRQTAWFVVATLLYLFLMQGWAGIDTTWGIVRAAAAGMLLQIGLTVSRNLLQKEGLSGKPPSPRIELPIRWLVTAAAATSVWLLSVLMLSPDKPQTLTKLPFPETAFRSSTSSTTEAQTGYRGSSDLLGSPVKPNPSIAFTAVSEQLTYWRGDVKYGYTGSGWKDRADAVTSTGHVNLATLDSSKNEELNALRNMDSAIVEQEVWLQDRELYGEWFSSGPIVDVVEATEENGKAVGIEGKFAHYKIRAIVPPTPGRIASSSVTDQDVWQKRLLEDEGQAEQRAREKHLALQLPQGVPARVAELAAVIVGEESDSLRAAALIRDYLRREYPYTMSESVRPATGTDFVDHFLFLQRQGYCDHFSTAMVVMLRTLGIPARWVKGYAPGEITDVKQDRLEITVRQADAHSWVEVWDEEWGWVPFEPTPAYTAELAPEPVVESGIADVPASAPIRASGPIEALPSYALLIMAAGYWITLAVNAIGNWNWWLLFGVTGMSGLAVVMLARGAAWVCMTGNRSLSNSPAQADSLSSLQEQWQNLERKHGGRRPAETLLEFSMRIPVESEHERKRWVSLAEKLYRFTYQDDSSSSSH